jgi:hypothetical protein
MKYLLSIALVCMTSVFVYANEIFSLLSVCQSESAYVLNLDIADGLGVELNPSHSPQQHLFESGVVRIPLENDWVEVRAIYVTPAPIQMLDLSNLPACAENGQQADPNEIVYRALEIRQEILGDYFNDMD